MSSLTERWPVRRLLSEATPDREEGGMARRDTGPDFIEALARGLDVIRAFGPRQPGHVAGRGGRRDRAGPADRPAHPAHPHPARLRPRRGWRLRADRPGAGPGHAYVLSQNLWEVARPHMEDLVSRTRESSSIAQLDGSDIVYVARVAVPKIIALAVTIGTRFPAMQTSLGKVLLAALPAGGGRAGARRAQQVRDHRQMAARAGRAGRRAARGRRARLGADRRAAGARGSGRWRRRCGTARAA